MLAHEPGYERFCDLCEDKSPGFADEDERCAIDALLRYADTTGRETMGQGQESPDFDQDLTLLNQGDMMEVEDEPESGVVELEPDALTPTISEEAAREEEAMDALAMLTQETLTRLIGDVFDMMEDHSRAAWILNRICALDVEQREEVARQAIQLDALAYAREKAAADEARALADHYAVKAETHRMAQRRAESALMRVVGPFATFGRGDAE